MSVDLLALLDDTEYPAAFRRYELGMYPYEDAGIRVRFEPAYDPADARRTLRSVEQALEEEGITVPFMDAVHDMARKRNGKCPPEIGGWERDFSLRYSQNAGNLNHMKNVVGLQAKMIRLFEDASGFSDALRCDDFPQDLPYRDDAKDRRAHLMAAAMLHDVFKTVDAVQHANRGSEMLLFALSNPDAPAHLSCFIAQNGLFNHEYLYRMLRYHDRFGVLLSGESGVEPVIEMLERLRALAQDTNISYRSVLFDLYALTCADIMASVKDKFVRNAMLDEAPGSQVSRACVLEFFRTRKGRSLEGLFRWLLRCADSDPSHEDYALIFETDVYRRIARLLLETGYQKVCAQAAAPGALPIYARIVEFFEDSELLLSVVRRVDFQEAASFLAETGIWDYGLGKFQTLFDNVFFILSVPHDRPASAERFILRVCTVFKDAILAVRNNYRDTVPQPAPAGVNLEAGKINLRVMLGVEPFDRDQVFADGELSVFSGEGDAI